MDLDTFAASKTDVVGFYTDHSEQHVVRSTHRKSKRLDLPRHGEGERFIRGPIPLAWMKLAAMCGHRSEAVALLLWYAAGFQRANPVKLSTTILAELRVHPKTAKRVLLRMAELGLVDNEFKRGRAPLVAIKQPEAKVVDDQ